MTARSPTWWAFVKPDGNYSTNPLGAPSLIGDRALAGVVAQPDEKPVEVRIVPVRRVLQAKRKRA